MLEFEITTVADYEEIREEFEQLAEARPPTGTRAHARLQELEEILRRYQERTTAHTARLLAA